MSKQEATRLADEAGNEIGKSDPQWGVIDAAIEMLRRWPDGEPVAEVEADGVMRFKKTGWKWKVGDKLYTAPPAESEPNLGMYKDAIKQVRGLQERIAALEAVIEQARVALEMLIDFPKSGSSISAAHDALRAIEEVQHVR